MKKGSRTDDCIKDCICPRPDDLTTTSKILGYFMLNAVAEGIIMVTMQSFVEAYLCDGNSSRAEGFVSTSWIGYNICNFCANVVLGALMDKVAG